MNSIFAGLIAAILSIFGGTQPIAHAPIVNGPPAVNLPASYKNAASAAAVAESVGGTIAASSSAASAPLDRAPSANSSAPAIKSVIVAAPLAADYVTQAQFDAALSQLGTSVRQLLATPAASPTSAYVLGDGNPEVPYAAVSDIGNLSNVTITNANLTASEIPDLSGSYLSLNGGTLTGAFSDSSTATSTFIGNLSIGGNLNFDGALLQNGLPFAGSQWTTSGSNIYYPTGNVGIGTTSPDQLLAVNGNIDVGASNSYEIGDTPILSASGGNTVIGYKAFASTTTGYNSTATGYEALYDNTTGYNNTAYGWSALYSNTTGADNTAIGYNTLYNNINGIYSTAIGHDALYNATTTGYNTATGYKALYSTTGGYNTADGYEALYDNNSGTYNVATGYNTFYDNTTGSYNSAMGYYAGFNQTAGSYNVVIGTDAGLASTTGSQQLNIGNVLYGTGLFNGTGGISSTPTSAGEIGIGTTNPYSRLQVTGPDSASSTSALAVVNSASTTEFAVFDGGNAELAGSLSQNSDQRLKTNIQSLTASSSLSLIDELNPVTFNWIDPNKGTTLQLGFIAQQVQQIFPNLISTTSPTALTPDGTLSLNYIGLISPIVSAIQDLSQHLTSLANTVAGFAQLFVSNTITANNELCVGSTCVTPEQFQAMVTAANASQSSGQGSSGATSDNTDATNTPPIIQISGDNPAIVQIGATYNDLGATITGPTADINLGIATYVNGIAMSPVQIDTSAAATDTIDYVVTDQNGLISTSTRTVIVEAPSIVPTDEADTGTDATTSAAAATTTTQ